MPPIFLMTTWHTTRFSVSHGILAVTREAVADVIRFGSLQSLVRSIRNAKAEYKVEPGKKIPAIIKVQQRVYGFVG